MNSKVLLLFILKKGLYLLLSINLYKKKDHERNERWKKNEIKERKKIRKGMRKNKMGKTERKNIVSRKKEAKRNKKNDMFCLEGSQVQHIDCSNKRATRCHCYQYCKWGSILQLSSKLICVKNELKERKKIIKRNEEKQDSKEWKKIVNLKHLNTKKWASFNEWTC